MRLFQSRFFQVASIAEVSGSEALSVENRTVVFRGFADNSNSLLAISDSRAEKCEQWLQQPISQICWYFTKTREQYRISNKVELIKENSQKHHNTNKDIRKLVWDKLSAKAKEQFQWPTPKLAVGNASTNINVNNEGIPDTFVVIMFTPHTVDYLNLTTSPQTREIHDCCEASGTWRYKLVNP